MSAFETPFRVRPEENKDSPCLVSNCVAPNTRTPESNAPLPVVWRLIMGEPGAAARIPVYQVLELRLLNRNCCFGRLPCPRVVMVVLTMLVNLPPLMAEICA